MQSIKFLRPLSFSPVAYRASTVKSGGFRFISASVMVQKLAVPRLQQSVPLSTAFGVASRKFSFSSETTLDVPVLDTESKLFLQNGQPFTGHGEVTLQKGTYTGDFVDGKRHGHGVYKSRHGPVYVGEWKDNHKNGNGTVTDAEGRITSKGLFKNGIFVTGTGISRTNHGSLYNGELLDGLRHGQGKFTSKSGEMWEGEFRHGEPFNGKGRWHGKQGVWVEGVFRS